MKNELTRMFDPESRLALVAVDCTAAAAELARAHLCGQSAAAALAEALAAVAFLGSETSRTDETASFRLDCPGPLGGFLVEATEKGTLRGYPKKKILNDLDGLGRPKTAALYGETGTFEVIRSVPGKILSSGTVAVGFGRANASPAAQGLETFFAASLQRRVKVAAWAVAGEDGVPVLARGLMAECPPDGDAAVYAAVAELFDSGAATRLIASPALAPRTLLKKLGLPRAEMRGSSPLAFACRCSAARAAETLAALSPAERAELPDNVDVVCHMCGRTWSVPTRA